MRFTLLTDVWWCSDEVHPVGGRHHDFGDEVAYCGGRLLWLQLSEDVALVLVAVDPFLGDEAEHSPEGQRITNAAILNDIILEYLINRKFNLIEKV